MSVIPIPRFNDDLEREALEKDVAIYVRRLSQVSTANQFTHFMNGLTRMARDTGKMRPGHTGLSSEKRG